MNLNFKSQSHAEAFYLRAGINVVFLNSLRKSEDVSCRYKIFSQEFVLNNSDVRLSLFKTLSLSLSRYIYIYI